MTTEERGFTIRLTPVERIVLGIFGASIIGSLAFIGSEVIKVRDNVQILVYKDSTTSQRIQDHEERIRDLEAPERREHPNVHSPNQ